LANNESGLFWPCTIDAIHSSGIKMEFLTDFIPVKLEC
jgi:hypothetical protein